MEIFVEALMGNTKLLESMEPRGIDLNDILEIAMHTNVVWVQNRSSWLDMSPYLATVNHIAHTWSR